MQCIRHRDVNILNTYLPILPAHLPRYRAFDRHRTLQYILRTDTHHLNTLLLTGLLFLALSTSSDDIG